MNWSAVVAAVGLVGAIVVWMFKFGRKMDDAADLSKRLDEKLDQYHQRVVPACRAEFQEIAVTMERFHVVQEEQTKKIDKLDGKLERLQQTIMERRRG